MQPARGAAAAADYSNFFIVLLNVSMEMDFLSPFGWLSLSD
jgi:hypothetical protein